MKSSVNMKKILEIRKLAAKIFKMYVFQSLSLDIRDNKR